MPVNVPVRERRKRLIIHDNYIRRRAGNQFPRAPGVPKTKKVGTGNMPVGRRERLAQEVHALSTEDSLSYSAVIQFINCLKGIGIISSDIADSFPRRGTGDCFPSRAPGVPKTKKVGTGNMPVGRRESDTGRQLRAVHFLNGFQFKETRAAEIGSDNIL